jgi:hypothetical protein
LPCFTTQAPTGCEHEHAGCRNVEKVKLVSAGAADIEHRASSSHRINLRIDRPCEERVDEGRDLRRRLSLFAQRNKKICLGRIGHVRRDKLPDNAFDLCSGK